MCPTGSHLRVLYVHRGLVALVVIITLSQKSGVFLLGFYIREDLNPKKWILLH